MQKNRLLLIAYYWPPSGGSGVQRWINLSNHLIDLGWEIFVITAKNPNYDQVDHSLLKKINTKISVFKVPIFEPAKFFKSDIKNRKKGSSFLKKTLTWIRANLFFPDSRMFWINKTSEFAIEIIRKNKIDSVITTGPPFSSHLIGLKIKSSIDVKWISDFRDPWVNFFQFNLMPINFYLRYKHRKYENECLKLSDCILTTTPSLTEHYKKTNVNTYTITNGFNSFSKNNLNKKFILIYSGIMKSIQNPKNLWKVLNEICSVNQDFKNDFLLKMIGDIDYEIISNEDLNKMKDNVRFEDYMEKTKLDIELSKACAFILSSINMEGSKFIIPGKLYYYFSFRRPIISFCSTHDDTADIINKTQSGKVFDYVEKEKLKKYILELYSNFKLNKNNFQPVELKKYNFKSISQKLDTILKKNIN